MDHIHYKVKKGTTVIYSDYDPVVAEYSLEILRDTTNVYFVQADARKPEGIITSSRNRENSRRATKSGFCFLGRCGFLKR